MEKLSGLVLDVYDDSEGVILRELFPTTESLPEVIKEAHQVTPDERGKLPDSLFALVLLDEGETLRKFACVDEGNTALSVEYLLKVAHKLPLEAQKTAAENMVTACSWYGIDPPAELQKMALGLGTAMGVLSIPGQAKATGQEIDQKKATLAAGGSPSMINPALLRK